MSSQLSSNKHSSSDAQKNVSSVRAKKSHLWLSFLGLGLAIAILNLDMSIVNLALPSIGRQFHSTLSTLQWVNMTYGIALASSFCVAGSFGHSCGSRITFLYGVMIFLVGSLLCGLASHISVLLIGRVIQGIGMAATFPMCFILVQELFPAKMHAFVISLLTVFTGVNQAMGPTIGGLIITKWNWHWAFLINIPLCLISFLLIMRYAKTTFIPKKIRIDLISVCLLALGFFLFINSINLMSSHLFLSATVMTHCLLCLICFFYLIIRQKKISHPLIRTELFLIKPWLHLNVMRFLFQSTFSAIGFIIPLYLQNIYGYSALHAGLIMLYMAVPLAIASPVCGKLTQHYGARCSLWLVGCSGMLGCLCLAYSVNPLYWPGFIIGMVLLGVYIACAFSVTNYLNVCLLADKNRLTGTGMYYTIGFFGFSLGVAMCGYVIKMLAEIKLVSLWQGVFPVDWRHFIDGSRDLLTINPLLFHSPALAKHFMLAAQTGFSYALQYVLMGCAVLAAIGLLFTYNLKTSKESAQEATD